ncbi:hypothetical protein TNCV_4748661 [Trichonephila clavipes]|nr:hypothetical protein TNCV_4748661 [Trichonephila clavipes]
MSSILVPLKTRHVEELMLVKFVEPQSPQVTSESVLPAQVPSSLLDHDQGRSYGRNNDGSGASEINRLYPESRGEKRMNRNAISENTRRRGRPVEEEAKRERNRSDVTRARVEERRKGAKSPKTRSRSTKTQ